MLVQKQNAPYVRVFKMSTGEEIIAKVIEETLSSFVVEKPLQMVMGQRGFQFAPFMMMVDSDKSLNINRNQIIADSFPLQEIEGQYESITTGIALPQKNSIIT